MWQAIKEIAGDSTIYWKQFKLFLTVAVIGGLIWGINNWNPGQPATASAVVPPQWAQTDATGAENFDVVVSEAGKVTVNGQIVDKAINFSNGTQQFLLVLAEDVTAPIPAIGVTVHLPFAVTDLSSFAPQIYAFHGGASLPRYQKINDQTIYFSASNIDTGSGLSIALNFPSGYLRLNLSEQLAMRYGSLSPQVWLIIGVTLPLLTILFLLWLLMQKTLSQWRVRNGNVIATPPEASPPGVIGTLANGKIGSHELTATLLDLANRGFITIHQKLGGQVAFGKNGNLFNQQATQLRPYEIFLLHQLFGSDQTISKGDSVIASSEERLFSDKMALAMLNMYDAALAEGFFIESPNKYYQKFKYVGFALFFISLISILYGTLALTSSDLVLFFWAGMMIASLLIVRISPGLPRRTRLGDQTLSHWMAFKNYLTARERVENVDPSQLFSYLPYAVVFGVADKWLARWQGNPVPMPAWFSRETVSVDTDQSATSLLEVISAMTQVLFSSRSPDVA